jgi:hypothetical protein
MEPTRYQFPCNEEVCAMCLLCLRCNPHDSKSKLFSPTPVVTAIDRHGAAWPGPCLTSATLGAAPWDLLATPYPCRLEPNRAHTQRTRHINPLNTSGRIPVRRTTSPFPPISRRGSGPTPYSDEDGCLPGRWGTVFVGHDGIIPSAPRSPSPITNHYHHSLIPH